MPNDFTLAHLKRVTPKTLNGLPGRILVGEHDGRLWLSQSYWLMPADVWASALRDCNLPTDAPFVAERRGASFVRTEQQAPNFGPVIDPNKLASGKVEQLMVGDTNVPAYMLGGDGVYQLPFRCPDDDGERRLWGLNVDYHNMFVAHARKFAPELELSTAGNGKPVVYKLGGEFVGLVMPIRNP